MIKSMTAYGRASTSTSYGRLSVELNSVNRKTLDVSVYIPKDLLRFEIQLRKWLSLQLERGQITLRITSQQEGGGMQVQMAPLKRLKESWDQIARTLGYDPHIAVTLEFLVAQVQGVSPEEQEGDEAQISQALQKGVTDALIELMKMKQAEGKALQQDIEKRLGLLEKALQEIEARKEAPLLRYRKKIGDLLGEFPSLAQEMQERVAREVALLAEKLDVTEEVIRLRSHFQQFHTHLASQEKSVGRTLDFLAQEMNREINTLAAKSADAEASSLVVGMKSELEKIREQVQNIE